MAKKYLLYIHDERFNDEQEKSKLVNDLLESYYRTGASETISAQNRLVESELPIAFQKAIKVINTPQQAKEAMKPTPKPATIRYCKHNNPLGSCMDKKADRSCKQ